MELGQAEISSSDSLGDFYKLSRSMVWEVRTKLAPQRWGQKLEDMHYIWVHETCDNPNWGQTCRFSYVSGDKDIPLSSAEAQKWNTWVT